MPSNVRVLKRQLKKLINDDKVRASVRLAAIVRFCQLDGLLPKDTRRPVATKEVETPAVAAAAGIDLNDLVEGLLGDTKKQ